MATQNQFDSGELSRDQLLNLPEIREKIAVRAYEIHEQRGRVPGREIDDWVQAENEIIAAFEQPGAVSVATTVSAKPQRKAPASRKPKV